MTWAYATGENTGIGFITHEDHEAFAVAEYPGNVFVVGDCEESQAWVIRNQLTSITHEDAQERVNVACEGQVAPDNSPVTPPVVP